MHKKRNDKVEKAVDVNEDDFAWRLLTMDMKKEKVKRKVWIAENVNMPVEAGMLYTIDGDTFFLFIKNMWIGD